MFDIGWDELLFTGIIAILVIGPKDLPRALRTAGQWLAKIRRVSGHFRAGIDTMIREAELEEMERHWREQNAAIMAAHPPAAADADPLVGTDPGTLMEPLAPPPADHPEPAPAKPPRKAPAKKAPAKKAAPAKAPARKAAAKPRAKAAK